jgi:hypothetical protein
MSVWNEILQILLTSGALVVGLGWFLNSGWAAWTGIRQGRGFEFGPQFLNLAIQLGALIAVIYFYGARIEWVGNWDELWGGTARLKWLAFLPPTAILVQLIASIAFRWTTENWRKIRSRPDDTDGFERPVPVPRGLSTREAELRTKSG